LGRRIAAPVRGGYRHEWEFSDFPDLRVEGHRQKWLSHLFAQRSPDGIAVFLDAASQDAGGANQQNRNNEQIARSHFSSLVTDRGGRVDVFPDALHTIKCEIASFSRADRKKVWNASRVREELRYVAESQCAKKAK
jgi:hypothetical protein